MEKMPLASLPALAASWRFFDFFAQIPESSQASLLATLCRAKPGALLVSISSIGPVLLLRMRSAVALLEQNSSGQRAGAIACQPTRQGNAWILALTPGPGNFPPGPLELSTDSTTLRIGSDGLQLRQMTTRIRHWSWRWKPTCGAGFLTVYLDRTANQIHEWLRVHPYLDPDENRKLIVRDGALVFCTSRYRGLSREQAAYDHSILEPLAQGALGELSFDVVDSDYGTLCATEHSCAEFAAYLTPGLAWSDQRYALTVRLRIDEEPMETIRLAIVDYSQLPGKQNATWQQILQQTPIARLPRWLIIEVPLRMAHVSLQYPEPWNHRIRRHTVMLYPEGLWELREAIRSREIPSHQELLQGVAELAGESFEILEEGTVLRM